MKFAYLIEPPFNFRDEADIVRGHDVEIAQHVFGQLGEDFEPIETEFAQLLPGLSSGHWHMTTGLFATRERRAHALFTRPIWALPDGLLVRADNPHGLTGYHSIAASGGAILAVIRDQAQHRAAQAAGVPEDRTLIFETYAEAARAVREGRADAYASVARAHAGFLERNPDGEIAVVDIPADEKPPAAGAFALPLGADDLLARVDAILDGFLGGAEHRRLATAYGFTDEDIALIA